MTINNPDIIECPACGDTQLRSSLGSGNTSGALFFSDGQMIAPMLPRYPWLIKCRKCAVYFKIDKKTVKGSADYGDERPYVTFLSIEDTRKALANGLFNASKADSEEWENEMLDMRIELWWAFNMRLRGDSLHTENIWRSDEEKDAYTDNCRELLRMLAGYREDEDYLRRAEICRNIGAFDECRLLLDKVSAPEKYEKYISDIRGAADAQNAVMFEIK